LKLEFRVVPGDAAEVLDEHLSPLEICQLNAHRKARAVAKKIPDALVLGADTLVFLDGEIMGKPRDAADARRMLTRLQGRTHRVVTGVSLIHLREHRERLFAEATEVTFRPLSAGQIGDYLSKINPLDKAGAYAVQEHGDAIIAAISGSRSNVVGLPLEKVADELAAWNR
jgi:septum formation protein